MGNMIAWIGSHWMPVAVIILSIDQVLIPLFPNAKLLVSLKDFLMGLGVKKD